MKNISAILLIIIVTDLSAQNHLIGARGGVNLSNAIYSNDTNSTAFITGFAGGLTYEYLFNERISLGIDFLYNQRGRITELKVRDELSLDKTEYDMRLASRYSYLSTPIKISYRTTGNLYGFGSLGVMPSLLSRMEDIYPEMNYRKRTFQSYTIQRTNRYDPFDIGGIAEVGIGYRTSRGLNVFALAGYQHSFTNNRPTEQMGSVGYKIQHYGIMASLGVKYAIGSKTE